MNETLITLDNLSIGYNSQPVLSGISLSIARGSFTAILGANGSGKSTLTQDGAWVASAGRGPHRYQATRGAPLVFGYVPQSIQFDPVYLLTGFEVALMGTYGRVRPGAYCAFTPNEHSLTNAFERLALRSLPASVCRTFRRPETTGAHRPRPDNAPRHPGAGRTDRGCGPRCDACGDGVHFTDPQGKEDHCPACHTRLCGGAPTR